MTRPHSGSQQLVDPPSTVPSKARVVRPWMSGRVAADDEMRAAVEARLSAPPPQRSSPDPADLFGDLTGQHNALHHLLQRLSGAPAHGYGPRSPRDVVREVIFPRIDEHERVEREFLWPLVGERLDDGEQWRERDAGLDIPGAARRVRDMAPDDGFGAAVSHLQAQVRRHAALCDALFQHLRGRVGAEESERLGRESRGRGSDPEGA